jgi:hypothetical protein
MAQSLLATDGYKFSMAEAGWPLRTETFYYSHGKGGPQVLPVDVPAFVGSLLPRPADDDYRYLAEHSYEMGPGFKAAMRPSGARPRPDRSPPWERRSAHPPRCILPGPHRSRPRSRSCA